MAMECGFELISEEDRARRGRWRLPHGIVETPAFMPVGTQGSVKTLIPSEVKEVSEGIMLCNTYHLLMRPGAELIERQGGLHQWIRWDGNILTDSGGFQVMSLAQLRKLTPDGVWFQSHIDGRKELFTPESVLDAQLRFGSDVMMVLDECTPYPVEEAEAAKSMELSMTWARRAQIAWAERREAKLLNGTARPQLLGIMQGGMFPRLRERSAARLVELNMDGYAVGGLSVGEPRELFYEIADMSAPLLPRQKIRYLMGVGKPEDLVEAVAAGFDVFDCVLPTRNARNGGVFLTQGPDGNIRNQRFREEQGPLDPACGCRACRGFSASFLHHLFKSQEMTALRLLTEHNLWYVKRLMERIREAIAVGQFAAFRASYRVDKVRNVQ